MEFRDKARDLSSTDWDSCLATVDGKVDPFAFDFHDDKSPVV